MAGYNARLHESLGERHKGHHKQSMKSRSHESEAMEKKEGHHKYGGVKSMHHGHDHHHKMAKHHHSEMKKHIDHLHKMAKGHHKHEHITAHDKAVDRKNLKHARSAKHK